MSVLETSNRQTTSSLSVLWILLVTNYLLLSFHKLKLNVLDFVDSIGRLSFLSFALDLRRNSESEFLASGIFK